MSTATATSCSKCADRVRRRFADNPAMRGLVKAVPALTKLRIAACADCAKTAKTKAADGDPSAAFYASGSDPSFLTNGSTSSSSISPGSTTMDPSLLGMFQSVATNPAALNAAVTLASGGKLTLNQPTLGQSLPQSPYPTGPVGPVAPPAAPASSSRNLEIILLVGVVVIALIAVVKFRKTEPRRQLA